MFKKLSKRLRPSVGSRARTRSSKSNQSQVVYKSGSNITYVHQGQLDTNKSLRMRERPSGSKKKLPNRSLESRRHKKNRRLNFETLMLLCIILLILGKGLYLSNEVIVANSRKDDDLAYIDLDQQLQSFASEWLKQKSVLLKTRFNHDEFISDLKTRFPQIDDIAIRTVFFGGRAELQYLASPPIAKVGTSDNFLISLKGIAVTSDTGYDLPMFIPANQVVVGQSVLSEEQAGFISSTVSALGQMGIKVDKIETTQDPRELRIYTDDKGYYIKVYTAGDPVGQSAAIVAAKKWFNAADIEPSEYIDARLGNRVIYR